MAARYSTPRSSDASEGANAIDLLSEDHRKVDELFADYESSKDSLGDQQKESLVAEICHELTVHASLEEEIFYPAARAAVDEEDAELLDEAEVEHATVKELVAQLTDMSASDDLYDAKVKVLGEYVKHHVQEEEGEIFPSVRETDLDLEALGSEIAARKDELRGELITEEVE